MWRSDDEGGDKLTNASGLCLDPSIYRVLVSQCRGESVNHYHGVYWRAQATCDAVGAIKRR